MSDMKQRIALLDLNDEEDDGNFREKKLLEFYERSLPFLMTYRVQDVPYEVKRDIAVMLHDRRYFNYEWMKYANEMGITDGHELSKINASAESQTDQPIFIAMHVTLSDKFFDRIIRALLKTGRHDVLRKIEPYVRELIESNSKTGVKRVVSVEMQYFGLHTESEEPCTIKLNSAPLDGHEKLKFDSFQQCSANTCSESVLQTHNPPKSIESPPENAPVLPSAPAKDKVSVLIPHTEFDTDTARQLSARLREEGMVVLTLFDLFSMSRMNLTNALATVFQQVDFIVPVVSDSYLKQVNPQDCDIYLESNYAVQNRYLHELIVTEYTNNRCMNYRVRPVIVPNMSKRLLTREVILSHGLRLWNEVETLITVLKQTKELKPQELVH